MAIGKEGCRYRSANGMRQVVLEAKCRYGERVEVGEQWGRECLVEKVRQKGWQGVRVEIGEGRRKRLPADRLKRESTGKC